MKILFLHGWQSVPGGVKPTFLKESGHEVLNPKLPDDDFPHARAIAQEAFDSFGPSVIVGSSRGGALAMSLSTSDTGLVLLCPAWKKYGFIRVTKPQSIVLHSRQDETVPFADSEELIEHSGLPRDVLIETGSDHRLADAESLAAMLTACERLARRIR